MKTHAIIARPFARHFIHSGNQSFLSPSFDRFFGDLSDFFEPDREFVQQTSTRTPHVTFSDQVTHYALTAELPGVNKEDVKIEVQGDALKLTAERKVKNEKEEGKLETLFQFVRSFELPEDVDTEAVKAKFENGLLELTLSKAKATSPKQIEIH